ncbi:hypothetical protein DL764_003050 [Monosporascus ibericus]|uniref:Heterokaryon incompatibility domain-containing protein n=1 Tax=Monosporascus ibericus TaxID=155417 RepID=A0A4Q4TJ79_9PEZI|nr:hypothetical protein DL764_003050 [Monosporascus ibericus]
MNASSASRFPKPQLPADLRRYYKLPTITETFLELEAKDGTIGELGWRTGRPAVSERFWVLQRALELIYGPPGYVIRRGISHLDSLTASIGFCSRFGYTPSNLLGFIVVSVVYSLLRTRRTTQALSTFPTWILRLVLLLCCVRGLQVSHLWDGILRQPWAVVPGTVLAVGAAFAFRWPGLPDAKFEYQEKLRHTTLWDPHGTQDHGYADTDHPDDISVRLLHLHPRLPFHPVTGSLLVTALGLSGRPRYEAISYTWGKDPTKKKTLIVDGKAFLCTTATYEALRDSTSWWRSRYIWIDYVCIDQSDKLEKNYQVGCMKYIYSRAECVRVQMVPPRVPEHGTRVDASGVSVFVQRIAGFVDNWDPSAADIVKFFQWEQETFGRWDALVEFFANPWFSRVWIIQEAVCASPVTVYYGSRYVNWNYMGQVANVLAEPAVLPLLRRARHGLRARENALRLLNIMRIRNMHKKYYMYVPYMHRDPNMRSLFHIAMPWRISPLSDLLSGFRYFDTTDPRDKIYALLGLIVDKERPHPLLCPDYAMSPSELMNLTARHLINAGSYFDVISFVGTGHARMRDGESQAKGMASWAADWTCAPLGVPLHDPRSANFARIKYGAADQADELWMQGERSDEIAAAWPGEDGSTWFADEPVEIDPATGRPAFNRERVRELVGHHDRALEFVLRAGGTDESDARECLWRTLIGDRTETERPAPWEAGQLYARWVENTRALMTCNVSELSAVDRIVPHLTAWNDLLWKCAVGRRLCLTTRGHMGMVPMGARAGDSVAFLYGAATPFVLRKVWGDPGSPGHDRPPTSFTKATSGLYEFIGQCYVHGVMDGEALRGEGHSDIFRIW